MAPLLVPASADGRGCVVERSLSCLSTSSLTCSYTSSPPDWDSVTGSPPVLYQDDEGDFVDIPLDRPRLTIRQVATLRDEKGQGGRRGSLDWRGWGDTLALQRRKTVAALGQSSSPPASMPLTNSPPVIPVKRCASENLHEKTPLEATTSMPNLHREEKKQPRKRAHRTHSHTGFLNIPLDTPTPHTPQHHMSGGRLSGQVVEKKLHRGGRKHLGMGLSRTATGLYVTSVWAQWPAHQAGLRFGDQILKVDGISIGKLGVNEVLAVFAGKPSVTIRLISHPLEHTVSVPRSTGNPERLGVTFIDGVIVKIAPYSPVRALACDLLHHVIVSINGHTVVGLPDCVLVRRFQEPGNVVSFGVMALAQFQQLVPLGGGYGQLQRMALLDVMLARCAALGHDVTTATPSPHLNLALQLPKMAGGECGRRCNAGPVKRWNSR